jgi:CheY-like chemotaxis protein
MRSPLPNMVTVGVVPFLLVLDDDADLGETLSGVLEDDGYSVCTVLDPATALEKLASMPIGLVVMDYAIPDPANGEAFLRAKAGDPRIANIPVIVMSGYRLDGQLPGTAAVLAKPFKAEALLSAVQRLLGPPDSIGNGS